MALVDYPNYWAPLVKPNGQIDEVWYRRFQEQRKQLADGWHLVLSPGLSADLTDISPGDTLHLNNTGVRSLVLNQPPAGLTINSSGTTLDVVSTFALANDLAAVEGLGTFGFTARVGTDSWVTRTLTGTANNIDITNGAGNADPVFSISPTYPGQTSITTLGTISQVGSISTPTFIQFDTAYTGSTSVGQLAYNASEGGLEVQMAGGNVTLQIGQEQIQRGYNRTGGTLLDGTVVYVKGAHADQLEIAIADNASDTTSEGTIGIVTEHILNNSAGWFTVMGEVHGLDTHSFSEGDTLFLGTAGAWTTTEPIAPKNKVVIGYVVRSHPTQGIIFVHVTPGKELGELDDVYVPAPSNGDVLTYDTANTRWKSAPPATSGTVTSVAMTVPSFLSVSGSPITSSGTLAVTLSGTALPVLNGGTGVTTSTGSGSNVLNTSPTLVTPALGAATGTSLTTTSNVTSDTGFFTGTAGGTLGYASVRQGDSTHTGYYTFQSAAGTRQGYIGFSTTTASADAGTIPYVAGIHAFTGAATHTSTDSATAFIPTGSTVPALGFYTAGTNILSFSTASTERLRIDASGFLGLNKVPAEFVDLVNPTGRATIWATTTAAASTAGLKLTATAGSAEWQIQAGTGSTNNLAISSTAGGEAVRVLSTIALGIGMTPVSVLDITKNQAASASIRLLNNDAGASADARLILSNGTNTGAALITRGTGHATEPNALVLSSGGNYPLNVYTNSAKHAIFDTAGNFVLPKTSGVGLQVDAAGTPTFAYRDLFGPLFARGSGPTDPGWNTFRNGIKAYQFTVNDEIWINFHLDHDYVPGTDIYIHSHWSHASATVSSGGVTWSYEMTVAKGHQQGATSVFGATKTTSVTQTASPTTQYEHFIAETVMSSTGGSATLLDNALFEPDTIIMVRCYLSGNTINGTPEPFLLMCDLHYQSTGMGTKAKAPNFYT